MTGGLSIPGLLSHNRVPVRVLLITAAVSFVLLLSTAIGGLPLWVVALAALIPWVPVCCVEAIWQYRHYGFYAFFGVLVLLQLGHLGEHAAQLIQLYLTHGNPARSHGVFGQLDLETVHFLWNVAVWLGAGALLYRFGWRNPWLWIAFAAASVHMVEHFYLYGLYVFQYGYWLAGGSAGIMAAGGVIGSPLDRPYLHFGYNILEITPLVVAFVDQTRRVYDRYLARALPSLSERELIATTAKLLPLRIAAGAVLVARDGPTQLPFIVASGEVEVAYAGTNAEPRLQLLHAGEFFGEIWGRGEKPPAASLRTTRPTEILALRGTPPEVAGLARRP
jgi:hypothetical protein